MRLENAVSSSVFRSRPRKNRAERLSARLHLNCRAIVEGIAWKAQWRSMRARLRRSEPGFPQALEQFPRITASFLGVANMSARTLNASAHPYNVQVAVVQHAVDAVRQAKPLTTGMSTSPMRRIRRRAGDWLFVTQPPA